MGIFKKQTNLLCKSQMELNTLFESAKDKYSHGEISKEEYRTILNEMVKSYKEIETKKADSNLSNSIVDLLQEGLIS